jgi:hypothetical protein
LVEACHLPDRARSLERYEERVVEVQRAKGHLNDPEDVRQKSLGVPCDEADFASLCRAADRRESRHEVGGSCSPLSRTATDHRDRFAHADVQQNGAMSLRPQPSEDCGRSRREGVVVVQQPDEDVRIETTSAIVEPIAVVDSVPAQMHDTPERLDHLP